MYIILNNSRIHFKLERTVKKIDHILGYEEKLVIFQILVIMPKIFSLYAMNSISDQLSKKNN